MRLHKSLIVPVLAVLATPQVANAGVVVEFALKKQELSTPQTRELLLERIKEFSVESCASDPVHTTKSAVRWCAEDLTAQFVENIDNDELTLLAETSEQRSYRSASR